ncbi:MAG: Na/Pi symporter [Lentisphaerae bacterium]|nr:Na/Pi symporter [Lentisphaerota bacterium]
MATITISHGGEQLGRCGELAPKSLTVEVLGPKRRGLLGGSGHARPVPNVKVLFEPLSPERGLEIVGEPEQTTNEGGTASVEVRLGRSFGDQYVRIRLPNHPGISALARLTAGIAVYGSHQETLAGEELPAPLTLALTDESGEPLSGIPVHFRLSSQPGSKGKLSVSRGKTNSEGQISVNLKTDPKATGRYMVTAEIADPEQRYAARAVVMDAMAINRTGLMLGVLGGLGLFIFGMTLMSEGLQQIAGPRLRTVLQFLAQNRFVGVLAGATVTAVIQSSSACTVMVVGFVNAGLLNLQQSIGIIMGAAIGTTVTGQMVSLKLEVLALPAIAFGVTMLLIARRSATRSLAQTIVGFGMLFLGMTMMSAQLKGLAQFPSFIRFFSTFDCQPLTTGGSMPWKAVFGAVVIGTIMTMVVQSSSATIGLTIALASSGLVNFYTAIPLILGDNIGTTITAILASIGTNRKARQAAIAHTVFKMIGATYMIILFYVPLNGVPIFMHIVDLITAGDVFAATPENIGRHVASAHTLFNIVNVLAFLPFVGSLAWLSERILPSPADEALKVQTLEPHLLTTPSFALEQVETVVRQMGRDAWKNTEVAVRMLTRGEKGSVEAISRREARIDEQQHDIAEYLAKLTQRALTEAQSDAIPRLMHCAHDAERMGDHAINILDLVEKLTNGNAKFSKAAIGQLDEMLEIVRRQAEIAFAAPDAESPPSPDKVLRLEGELRKAVEQSEQDHERRLRRGKCDVQAGLLFVELLNDVRRIGEHLGNIAQRMLPASVPPSAASTQPS